MPTRSCAALTRSVPDVIVIDVGMDGTDAIDTIGRVMTVHPTPVVVMSATTPEGAEAAIRAMEAGAVEVLAKPSWSVDPGLAALAGEIVRKILAAAQVRPARIAAARSSERRSGAVASGSRRLRGGGRLRRLDSLRGDRRLYRRAGRAPRRSSPSCPGSCPRRCWWSSTCRLRTLRPSRACSASAPASRCARPPPAIASRGAW